MRKSAALAMTAALVTFAAVGCGTATASQTSLSAQETTLNVSGSISSADASTVSDTSNAAINADGLDLEFTANDLDTGYDEQNNTLITASGSSITVSGSGSSGVTVDGSTATITAEGTYILSGSITDGQIIVAADSAKVKLVLKGVDITCSDNAPIYIESADKVFITLAEGTESTLTDGATYTQNDAETNVDGVIYSKADLTLNGAGSLTIEGNYKHGIVSKDDLVITGGTYSITATGQGLYGQDCVKIKAGTFNLVTGGDAIQSDNAEDTTCGFIYIASGTFTIKSEGDAMQAETVLQIDGGTYDITTGGGSANASTTSSGQVNQNWGKPGSGTMSGTATATVSTATADVTATAAATTTASATVTDTVSSVKGLKAVGDLIVNGGTFMIDSSDDSLHSNANLTINNGTFTISSGDDGIHADTDLSILGGSITITKSYEGIEGYNITVSGGTIDLTSSDDGFNAAGGSDSSSVSGRPGQNTFTAGTSDMSLTITAGTVTVDAGGDGLDSNGSLIIEGGIITVSGPEDSGNGTLDFTTGTISGGTLMGAGSSGMMQTFDSTSTQASLAYSLSTTYEAGTEISLADADGNVLAKWTADKTFTSVNISTAELTVGETYTLTVGSDSQTVQLSSVSTSNGSTSGAMMGGGKGGH